MEKPRLRVWFFLLNVTWYYDFRFFSKQKKRNRPVKGGFLPKNM